MPNEGKLSLKALNEPVVCGGEFAVLTFRQGDVAAVIDPNTGCCGYLVSSVEKRDVRVENGTICLDELPEGVGIALRDPLLTFGLRESVKSLDGEDVGSDEVDEGVVIVLAELLRFVGENFWQSPLDGGTTIENK